jgi:GT2 family glycosyltransferase
VTGAQLEYECVICTCNRPEELRLSIPRILGQTRLPRRVIVVDSSEDRDAVSAVVAEVSVDAPCEVELIHTARGLTLQRNEGLRRVTADVVFFPDDDALCDLDYAEEILAIYERDTDEEIGAVIGTHRPAPPEDERSAVAAEMAWGARLRQRITLPRASIERRIARDPLAMIGWQLKASWRVPGWVAGVDAHPNCWVRGFRMTFRTQAVRDAGGFDENLRNYANFEDIHAGFAVGERKVVLLAHRALVFHRQAAGGRGSGRVRGATNIANRAYVVAAHSEPGSPHRRQAVRYGAYRCLLYGLGGIWSRYHRESLRGAFAVLVRLRPLLLAPREHAAPAYQSLLRRAGVAVD